jgi:hypothetical protein
MSKVITEVTKYGFNSGDPGESEYLVDWVCSASKNERGDYAYDSQKFRMQIFIDALEEAHEISDLNPVVDLSHDNILRELDLPTIIKEMSRNFSDAFLTIHGIANESRYVTEISTKSYATHQFVQCSLALQLFKGFEWWNYQHRSSSSNLDEYYAELLNLRASELETTEERKALGYKSGSIHEGLGLVFLILLVCSCASRRRNIPASLDELSVYILGKNVSLRETYPDSIGPIIGC